jgi:hypothetical protein
MHQLMNHYPSKSSRIEGYSLYHIHSGLNKIIFWQEQCSLRLTPGQLCASVRALYYVRWSPCGFISIQQTDAHFPFPARPAQESHGTAGPSHSGGHNVSPGCTITQSPPFFFTPTGKWLLFFLLLMMKEGEIRNRRWVELCVTLRLSFVRSG